MIDCEADFILSGAAAVIMSLRTWDNEGLWEGRVKY